MGEREYHLATKTKSDLTGCFTYYGHHCLLDGRNHLASAIGNGGLADIGHPIVDGDVNIETPPVGTDTKKAPSKRSGLLCCWLDVESLLEFLDLGLLAAQTTQIINA